jgi:DNA-binding GntR family transcriptional regulator
MRSDGIKAISRQTMEAQVVEALRSHILEGTLKPGQKITEITLSERMGVGRATLRMGLHRLASEGIVVQTPYTGWAVTRLSRRDVWELWTLRSSLDALAARLAAENINPTSRAKVETVYNALLNACLAGNEALATSLDFEFHMCIVEASGHSRLLVQYKLVEQQVRMYIQDSNALLDHNLAALINQHQPIFEAICVGDGERAAHEAQQHNQSEGPKLVASTIARDEAELATSTANVCAKKAAHD